MNHRFGRKSYALIHDFYLAERAIDQFRASPEWDTLPVEERDATYSLLLNRSICARRAVDEHPPWVMTPSRVIDGVACRTGAALERAMNDVLDAPLPDGAFDRIRDRVVDFVAADLRRVAFDARLTEGHLPTDRVKQEEKPLESRPVVLQPDLDQVAQAAARDHLGRFGIVGESSTYAERRERLQDFALDVISRYRRSRRGWLGWLFRRPSV